MTRVRTTETARGRSQRERVLAAAMDIFSTQGFRGASLDAVADAVGITRQGLLHYFPSKVSLLLGVLDLRQEQDHERVRALYEGSHGIADVLLALARRNQARPELIRMFTILASESVDADHPGHDWFVERYRGVRTRMIERIAAEQRAGALSTALAPESIAVLLLAVMDGLQIQHLLEPDAVDIVEPLPDLLALLDPNRLHRRRRT
jgi:AcrR family transcriptional regulator